jgi:hypothetical protein
LVGNAWGSWASGGLMRRIGLRVASSDGNRNGTFLIDVASSQRAVSVKITTLKLVDEPGCSDKFFVTKTIEIVSGYFLFSRDLFKILPSNHRSHEAAIKWRRIRIQKKTQSGGARPLPLAAPDRRSDPYLSLLVQRCGRFLALTCKVHCGKGLSRRPGGVVGRLIRHQGPISSTGGSRSVLSGWMSNRNCGGLQKWLNL